MVNCSTIIGQFTVDENVKFLQYLLETEPSILGVCVCVYKCVYIESWKRLALDYPHQAINTAF